MSRQQEMTLHPYRSLKYTVQPTAPMGFSVPRAFPGCPDSDKRLPPPTSLQTAAFM